MSNEEQIGIAIFIDIRGSSKILNEHKKKIYSEFYKKINKKRKAFDFSHISYVGDGILLFKKMDLDSQWNKLIEFLKEINKILFNDIPNEVSLENLLFGLGISYGSYFSINVENNNKDTEEQIVGSVLDEAAKASNIPNKIQYSLNNKYSLRIVSNKLMDKFQEKYGGDIKCFKKSASGKGAWLNLDFL